MEILNPFIKTTTEKDFANYKNLWNEFVKQYNADKQSGEQLKNVHRQIYYTLVRLSKKNIEINNKLLANSPLKAIENNLAYKIKTNRKDLSKFAFNGEKDVSSISLYISRLVDAGVIQSSTWHGAKNDFDLYINPDFLLIYDYSKEKYTPTSPYLIEKSPTENRGAQGGLLLKSEPVPDVSRLINNSTITIGVEKTFNKSYPEHSGNISGNTPQTGLKKEENKEEKEKSCAKKEKEDRRKTYLRLMARLFYQYMIEMLFKEHTINPTHATKTIDYIETMYFSGQKFMNGEITEKGIENLWEKQYKPRLDMAASYVKRSNYDMQYQFPLHYLSSENTKGFAATKKWKISSDNHAAVREVVKVANSRKLSDTDKLHNMVRLFSKHRNVEYLNICISYVRNTIPQFEKDFKYMINWINCTNNLKK